MRGFRMLSSKAVDVLLVIVIALVVIFKIAFCGF